MGLSLEWQIYKWINDELVIGNMDEKIYGHENWEGSLFSGTLLRKDFRRRQHWKSTLNIHSKDWGWSFNTLANWCEELTLWKIHWCWERLRVRGEGDHRGWDGWMASPTWCTWAWVNSGSWWWTGRPGMLWVGHNWVTELNWTELKTPPGPFTEQRTD